MNANKIHRLTVVDRQHKIHQLKKSKSYGIRNNSIRVKNVLYLTPKRKAA